MLNEKAIHIGSDVIADSKTSFERREQFKDAIARLLDGDFTVTLRAGEAIREFRTAPDFIGWYDGPKPKADGEDASSEEALADDDEEIDDEAAIDDEEEALVREDIEKGNSP